MLVLTRKAQEKIDIGPDIVVTVVEIDTNKVRIGVEAPKRITVDRREVTEAKKRAAAKKATEKALE